MKRIILPLIACMAACLAQGFSAGPAALHVYARGVIIGRFEARCAADRAKLAADRQRALQDPAWCDAHRALRPTWDEFERAREISEKTLMPLPADDSLITDQCWATFLQPQEWLSIHGGGQLTSPSQGPIICVAPQSAPPLELAGATPGDILPATAWQTLFNSIYLNAPKGAKIIFLDGAGTDTISGTINLTTSWKGVFAENRTFWGGYIAGWNGSTAVGLEGMQGAKIKASATGFNLLHISGSDGSETRLRNVCLDGLYFYGGGGPATWLNEAVVCDSGADICYFQYLFIQNVSKSLDLACDSPFVNYCNSQDNGGDGFTFGGGPHGDCADNTLFDNGGNGIVGSTVDALNLANNLIGVRGNYSVLLTSCTNCGIQSCTFKNFAKAGVATDGGSHISITGCHLENSAIGATAGYIMGLNAHVTTGFSITGGSASSSASTLAPAVLCNYLSTGSITGLECTGGGWRKGSIEPLSWVVGYNQVSANPGSASIPGLPGVDSWTPVCRLSQYALGTPLNVALNPVPADNTTITSISDLISNNAFTNAAGTPKFRTNVQNGLPSIQFDAASFLQGTSLLAATQPITVFLVVRNTGNGAQYSPLGCGGGFSIYTPNGATTYNVFAGTGQTLATFTNGQLNVVEVIFDHAHTLCKCKVNNGTATTAGDPGANNPASNFIIGADGNGSNKLLGYIDEVIPGVGVCSDADATLEYNALKQMYGTP